MVSIILSKLGGSDVNIKNVKWYRAFNKQYTFQAIHPFVFQDVDELIAFTNSLNNDITKVDGIYVGRVLGDPNGEPGSWTPFYEKTIFEPYAPEELTQQLLESARVDRQMLVCKITDDSSTPNNHETIIVFISGSLSVPPITCIYLRQETNYESNLMPQTIAHSLDDLHTMKFSDRRKNLPIVPPIRSAKEYDNFFMKEERKKNMK